MRVFKKILFPSIPILLAVVIAITAVFPWFHGGYILYFWDSFIPLDVKHSFIELYYYWSSNAFPGSANAEWSWLLHWVIVSAIHNAFSSLSLSEGIPYIGFVVASILNFYFFSNYLLTLVFKQNQHTMLTKIVSFIFAILYSLNLYTFYYSYFMFNPQIYIYSFLPLNLLALFKIYPLTPITKNDKKYLWILVFFVTIFLMIPGFTTYVFLLQYFIWLGFYFVLYIMFSQIKSPIKKIGEIVIFFVLIIILNWWWFYPAILGFKDLYTSQSALGTTVYFDLNSIGGYLLNSMRLLGSPTMTNNPFSWSVLYNSKLFSFPLFLFPLLIILTFVVRKKLSSKLILIYLLAMFLVSLFIVKLANPPFPQITFFAFEHVPFFGAFRDAFQKAGINYLFPYFSLASVGCMYAVSFLYKKSKTVLLPLFFIALGITSIIVTGPFFLFSKDNFRTRIFTYNNKEYKIAAKTKIPPEYYQLKSFLEPSCDSTAIIVIPRSSMISNAIWEKYGTSYIGQDMLKHLINCNFIVNQFLENGPDSFNFAPYILMQQNDFRDLEKFLIQNQIGKILIRKDYIPYSITARFYMDPSIVRKYMQNSKDFTKVYENSMFEVYDFTALHNNKTFGFALPSAVVSTNAALDNGLDYAILSKQLPTSAGAVIINSPTILSQYASHVNIYATEASCVGCVKIAPSQTVIVPQESIVTKIKQFVKNVLKRKSQQIFQNSDQEISYAIIDEGNNFGALLQSLNKNDYISAESNLSIYTSSLQHVLSLTHAYSVGFFEKNNILTEEQNFLLGQATQLSAYILANQTILPQQLLGKLDYLLSEQNNELHFLKDSIWQTDFSKNMYAMRLDIPQDGLYTCKAGTTNNAVKITNVQVLNKDQEINALPSNTYLLHQASYPVQISYTTNDISLGNDIRIDEGNLSATSLGHLADGDYELQVHVTSEKENDFAIIISKNKLSKEVLHTIGTSDLPQSDFITLSSVHASSNPQDYTIPFSINSLENNTNYLYIISLNPDSITGNTTQFTHVTLRRQVENNDIQFYCVYTSQPTSDNLTSALHVVKVDPTKYTVTLPQNYAGRFLTFNQTYAQDWVAYTTINGQKYVYQHIPNGYANAWYIDKAPQGSITIEYARQPKIIKNVFITVAAFIIIGVIYFILRRKYAK